MDNEVGNAEVDEEWDISESVCCICDDGGDVICCDGECFRSFHLSKGDSECPSLGLSKAEAERMDKFLCPNCKFKIHQCFVCRELGRSDSAAPEVFKCKVTMCGLYYHPHCVAKLILKGKDTSDEYVAMVESIKQGNWFDCPRHKCRKCGTGEDKENVEMQLGICRRCPRSWHRQCLPHSVLHPVADEPQRAWDDLLPNRILIYCERHTIIPKLGTPARNHVKFPEASLPYLQKRLVKRKAEDEEQRRKSSKLSFLKKRDEACMKSLARDKTGKLLKGNTERKVKPFLLTRKTKTEDCGFTKSKLDRDDFVHGGSITKVSKQAPAVFLIKGKNNVGSSTRQEWSSKEDKQRFSQSRGFSLSSKCTLVSDARLERSTSMVSKPQHLGSWQLQQKSKPLESKPIQVDIETRSMVKGIIDRAKSSITIEGVAEKYVVPDCYKRKPMNLDKIYTLIKIESIAKGMRKALETLNNGGSIEDAKVKCSPEFVKFMEMCSRHLRAYLCPFLHGKRYTSYGRHFTHPRKLAEIVERLHWYVDSGDMVVDFCCGSNDFSLLMKQKLEETGKKCEYKNFDLIQTNKDFNFFKGNWFEVKQDQFPDGNGLIIGLNPPFSLANQFINHALKFKPKLIVLIVPRETERLDQKRDMYDLIWEDNDLLGGKSFYLPGSLDEDDNTLDDWNIITSPLYLWSKPNWTFKHKQIALERGQISLNTSSRFVGSPCNKTTLWLPSFSDFEIEKDNNYSVPMEHGGGEASDSYQNKTGMALAVPKDGQDTGPKQESSSSFRLKEQNKSSIEHLESNMAVVEPNIVNELTDKQETAPIQDESDSLTLKDLNMRSRDLLECRNGERCGVVNISSKSSVVKRSVQVKDTSHKEQSTIEHPTNDHFVSPNQPEKPEGQAMEAPTKALEETSATKIAKNEVAKGKVPTKGPEEISGANIAKRDELAKGNSLQGQGHICAKEMEKGPLNWQKSPEGATCNFGCRDDVLGKQRKSNERYKPGDHINLGVQTEENYQQEVSEEHMHSLKVDWGEREAPNRQDRYEAGTRKLPDHCRRHGEESERSLGSTFAIEYRKEILDKPSHEIVSSSSDTKMDELREFGVDARGGSDNGYHDSMSHRAGYEDTKRIWATPGGHEGASENHPQANEKSKRDSLNSGLPRSASRYDNVANAGSKNLETQGKYPSSKGLYRQEALSARDQVPVHMPMSGRSGDTVLATQNRSICLNHSGAPRGMRGMQEMNYAGGRYGMPLQTEGLLRAMGAGRGSAILEKSFRPPHGNYGRGWPGIVRPSNLMPFCPSVNGSFRPQQVYGSLQPQQVYGSFQPQQRPPLGLHNPSQFSTYNPLSSGPACPQINMPHYPPIQKRQANEHAMGGWFED